MKVLELGTRKYITLENYYINFTKGLNVVYSNDASNLGALSQLISQIMHTKVASGGNNKISQSGTAALINSTPRSETSSFSKWTFEHSKPNHPTLIEIESRFLENTNKLYHGTTGQLFAPILKCDANDTPQATAILPTISQRPLESHLISLFNDAPSAPFSAAQAKSFFSIFKHLPNKNQEELSLLGAAKKLSKFRQQELDPNASQEYTTIISNLKKIEKKTQQINHEILDKRSELDLVYRQDRSSDISEIKNSLGINQAYYTLIGLKEICEQHDAFRNQIEELQRQIEAISAQIQTLGNLVEIKGEPILETIQIYIDQLSKQPQTSQELIKRPSFSKQTDQFFTLINEHEHVGTLEQKQLLLEKYQNQRKQNFTLLKRIATTKLFMYCFIFLLLPIPFILILNKKQTYYLKKMLYLNEKQKYLTIEIEELEDGFAIYDDLVSKNHTPGDPGQPDKKAPAATLPFCPTKNLTATQDKVRKYLNALNLYYDENSLYDLGTLNKTHALLKKYVAITDELKHLENQKQSTSDSMRMLLGESSISEIKTFIQQLEASLKPSTDRSKVISGTALKMQNAQSEQRLQRLVMLEKKRLTQIRSLAKEIENKFEEMEHIRHQQQDLQENLTKKNKQKDSCSLALDILQEMAKTAAASYIPLMLQKHIDEKVSMYSQGKYTKLLLNNDTWKIFNALENRYIPFSDLPNTDQELIFLGLRMILVPTINRDFEVPPMIIQLELKDIIPKHLDIILNDLYNLSSHLQIILLSTNPLFTRRLPARFKFKGGSKFNEHMIQNTQLITVEQG